MKKLVIVWLIMSMLVTFATGCKSTETTYALQVIDLQLYDIPDQSEVLVFQTKQELDAYANELDQKYGDGHHLDVEEFLDFIPRYDANYFEENALLLNRAPGSSSYKYAIKDVRVNQGQGIVTFLRISPGVISMDIHPWCLLVEIPQELAVETYQAEFEEITMSEWEQENAEKSQSF